MTARLEAAIKQLAPDELEQVTALAEALARNRNLPESEDRLKLTWIGCLAGGPDRTGLEAQQRATRMRMELLEKNMPK